jgi:hypothetical protein
VHECNEKKKNCSTDEAKSGLMEAQVEMPIKAAHDTWVCYNFHVVREKEENENFCQDHNMWGDMRNKLYKNIFIIFFFSTVKINFISCLYFFPLYRVVSWIQCGSFNQKKNLCIFIFLAGTVLFLNNWKLAEGTCSRQFLNLQCFSFLQVNLSLSHSVFTVKHSTYDT